jgi:hypothetical protein
MANKNLDNTTATTTENPGTPGSMIQSIMADTTKAIATVELLAEKQGDLVISKYQAARSAQQKRVNQVISERLSLDDFLPEVNLEALLEASVSVEVEVV